MRTFQVGAELSEQFSFCQNLNLDDFWELQKLLIKIFMKFNIPSHINLLGSTIEDTSVWHFWTSNDRSPILPNPITVKPIALAPVDGYLTVV